MDKDDPYGWRKKPAKFEIYKDPPEPHGFEHMLDEPIDMDAVMMEGMFLPDPNAQESDESERPMSSSESASESETEEAERIDIPTQIQTYEGNVARLLEDAFLDALGEQEIDNGNLVKKSIANYFSNYLRKWKTTQERLDDEDYLQYLKKFQDYIQHGQRELIIFDESDQQNFDRADVEQLDLICREFFRARDRERQAAAREARLREREEERRLNREAMARPRPTSSEREEAIREQDRRDRGDANNRPNIRYIR